MIELTKEEKETITISLELFNLLCKDSKELDAINSLGLLSNEEWVYINDTIEYKGNN